MDGATITFLIGIVGCVVGVLTFISSLQNKAQNNGVLEQKIEQALQGIGEIKTQIKESTDKQAETALAIRSHSEQISALYKTVEELKLQLSTAGSINEGFEMLAQTLRSLKEDSNAKT